MNDHQRFLHNEGWKVWIWICVIFLACAGCRHTSGDTTVVKQYKIEDIFIGDVVQPVLKNIPDGLQESDYTWSIVSEITNSDMNTGLEVLEGNKYQAVHSDFVRVVAQCQSKDVTYREIFLFYIYSDGDISVELKGKDSVLGDSDYFHVLIRFPEDMVEKGFDTKDVTIHMDDQIQPYFQNMFSIGGEHGKEVYYNLLFSPYTGDSYVTGTVVFEWGKSSASCDISLFNSDDPFQSIAYFKRTQNISQVNDSKVRFASISSEYNQEADKYSDRFGQFADGKYVIIHDGEILVDYMVNLPGDLLPESAEEVEYIITAIETEPLQVATLVNDKTNEEVPALVSTCDLVLIDVKTGEILEHYGHFEGVVQDKFVDGAYTSESQVYVAYAKPDFNQAIRKIWEDRDISAVYE